MVRGSDPSPDSSTPTGKPIRYSCRNASSDVGVIASWCSNTVCSPTTATSSSGNVVRTRCTCGSPCDTQPGHSIWNASSTTTRPRSDSSVMGADALNHRDTCHGGAGRWTSLIALLLSPTAHLLKSLASPVQDCGG